MFISIEVGASVTRIAAFDSFDDPKIQDLESVMQTGSYTKDLENIQQKIRKMTAGRVEGIGISLVGILDKEKSQLKIAPNLPSWVRKPIKNDLESSFGCPVLLDNNGTTAAIGEAMFGYGIDKDFVMIAWGTGIGGTSVEIVDGSFHVSPFEPGHVPLDWNGDLCACGQRGCLETTCGGAGIAKKYGKSPGDLNEEEWDEVIASFAQGLMNVIMMRPTELIVLTGTIVVRQADRLTQISSILEKRLTMFECPELKISVFQERAGLYGALGILKQNLALNNA